jgi:hypothetical protein
VKGDKITMRSLTQKRWLVMVLMALITIHLSVSPAFSAVQQQKKNGSQKDSRQKNDCPKERCYSKERNYQEEFCSEEANCDCK